MSTGSLDKPVDTLQSISIYQGKNTALFYKYGGNSGRISDTPLSTPVYQGEHETLYALRQRGTLHH